MWTGIPAICVSGPREIFTVPCRFVGSGGRDGATAMRPHCHLLDIPGISILAAVRLPILTISMLPRPQGIWLIQLLVGRHHLAPGSPVSFDRHRQSGGRGDDERHCNRQDAKETRPYFHENTPVLVSWGFGWAPERPPSVPPTVTVNGYPSNWRAVIARPSSLPLFGDHYP